jgi:P4 family phage/plasmid primase-like protien
MAVYAQPPVRSYGVGKGARDEVLGSQYLWVDLDIYKLQQPIEPETVIDLLQHFSPRPTQIVSSGQGLYAVWLLDTIYSDPAFIEPRNRWLEYSLEEFGADNCHNIDRVLRVPGSLNAKTSPASPCTTVDLYTDDTGPVYYELTDFMLAESKTKVVHLTLDPEAIPSNFPSRVMQLNSMLWYRISSQAEAFTQAGAPINNMGNVDRSRNDYYIACRLLDEPFLESPGVVASVLSHPEWFSGSRFRDPVKGGWGYVERTISAAMAEVQAKQEQAKDLSNLFVETANGPKFSAYRAQTAFIEKFHFRFFHERLYYYDRVRGLYVPETDQFVPGLLATSLRDGYVSKHADEVTRQLIQFAPRMTRTDDRWLNLQNGLLNIDTGVFTPEHTGSTFTTDQLPVSYKTPQNYEPIQNGQALTEDLQALDTLDRFVESIVGPKNVPLWWEFVGHTLINEVIQPGMLFLYGPPRTGKSQILTLLRHFLGFNNTSAADVTDIKGEGFTAPALVGKRANICFDTTADVLIDRTGFLKRVTSGEPVLIQEKYHRPFDATISAKLFFATNQAVFAKAPDEGWFRRIFVIPCDRVWTSSDEGFRANIGAALGSSDAIRSAMLHRALEGLARLRRNGEYSHTDDIVREREQLRIDSDTVLNWWLECTEPDEFARIPASILNKEYQDYTVSRGHQPVSESRFRQRTEALMREGLISTVTKKMAQLPNTNIVRPCWIGRRITQTHSDSLVYTTKSGESYEIFATGGKRR